MKIFLRVLFVGYISLLPIISYHCDVSFYSNFFCLALLLGKMSPRLSSLSNDNDKNVRYPKRHFGVYKCQQK